MPIVELAPAQPVRIGQIVRDPNQPRRAIAPEDLAGLVLSIRAHGVINPVVLSPHPDPAARDATPFMLVAGERRWAAARSAGLLHIPANLAREILTPAGRLMVQLEENDGELRRELSLCDRVDAVVRAFKLSGLRKDEFATAHGKTAAWLSHYLALATADGVTRMALEEGHVTGMLTARLFRRLGADDRLELLERARRNRLPITDRLVEAVAQRRDRGSGSAGLETFPSCPPSACAGAAGAADAAADVPITVALSRRQLAMLIVLLGEKPGPTPAEQIRQLQSFLRCNP
jgi:ParB family chromosome partitioning protein